MTIENAHKIHFLTKAKAKGYHRTIHSKLCIVGTTSKTYSVHCS